MRVVKRTSLVFVAGTLLFGFSFYVIGFFDSFFYSEIAAAVASGSCVGAAVGFFTPKKLFKFFKV